MEICYINCSINFWSDAPVPFRHALILMYWYFEGRICINGCIMLKFPTRKDEIPIYIIYRISYLEMIWWHYEPHHHQIRYWATSPAYTLLSIPSVTAINLIWNLSIIVDMLIQWQGASENKMADNELGNWYDNLLNAPEVNPNWYHIVWFRPLSNYYYLIELTHCSYATPFDGIVLSQHWIKQWPVAWWHQATIWSHMNLLLIILMVQLMVQLHSPYCNPTKQFYINHRNVLISLNLRPYIPGVNR